MATKHPDELEPLREYCKQGRLFEVQRWVAEGRPLKLKELPPKRNQKHSPLCIAIERGFHSLVQVLLEAGAPIEEDDYHALRHAVELRRNDLVELLIEHGAKVEDVSMQCVMLNWDRALVDLFVSHGGKGPFSYQFELEFLPS